MNNAEKRGDAQQQNTMLQRILNRCDGWVNTLTGLGGRMDKTTHTRPDEPLRMTAPEREALFYGNGTANAIITEVSKDMVRAGWEVDGDDGTLYKALQKLNAPQKFIEAINWTRLHGGALVVKDVAGAGRWDLPYVPGGKTRVQGLDVYPATDVTLEDAAFNRDPLKPWFKDYEWFIVNIGGGHRVKVHRSRCLVFKSPIRVGANSDGFTAAEKYWGMSVLPLIYDDLADLGASKQGVAHLMHELSIGKMTLSNLGNILAEDNSQELRDRSTAIAMQKSLIHMVLLGPGEDYKRENVALGGVGDVLDREMMFLSASSRYPVTKLFGRSAAGMNATGAGDADDYDEYVKGMQEAILLPPLKALVAELDAGLKVLPREGGEAPDVTITFNALDPEDESRTADTRLKVAQADAIYIDRGVLANDDVRTCRFKGGYSIETSVEDDIAPDLSPDDVKAALGGEPGGEA